MRPLTLAAPAALLFALAACAPTVNGDQHASEYQRLSDQCEARGGILAPTGQQTGRPQTENVCQITGGASRLTAGS
jgi:hypothetical protein